MKMLIKGNNTCSYNYVILYSITYGAHIWAIYILE